VPEARVHGLECRLQVLEGLHGLRLEISRRADEFAARVHAELPRKENDAGVALDLDDIRIARRPFHRRRIHEAQELEHLFSSLSPRQELSVLALSLSKGADTRVPHRARGSTSSPRGIDRIRKVAALTAQQQCTNTP